MAMAETMTTCRSKLPLRASSHAIMKTKPKIRIIHLFAPEVIETDPANFSDLVQRLTGKQAVHEIDKKKEEVRTSRMGAREEGRGRCESRCVEIGEWCINGWVKEEVMEEGMRMGSDNENCGNLLQGFGELDGFIEEFLEFPQKPSLGSTSYAELFGGSQVSSYVNAKMIILDLVLTIY